MAARNQPAYVESWDADAFPFHRERSGLVKYHQGVEITGEGDVLKGHIAVASAIVESWCSENPELFEALIDEWLNEAQSADDSDKKARQREDARLAGHPHLAAALERNAAEVFRRAELTPHQIRALELRLDGKSFMEIGFAFGVAKETAREHVERSLTKILALDAAPDDEA